MAPSRRLLTSVVLLVVASLLLAVWSLPVSYTHLTLPTN